MAVLSSNGTNLPSPVSIKVNDEIIWSSNTGRVSTGKMVGDIIANKVTLSVEWGVLTAAQVNSIVDTLSGAFKSITYKDLGSTFTKVFYKAKCERDSMGTIAGTEYYRSLSMEFTEQ